MEGGGHNEEVASSKKKTNSSLECKNRYPIHDQNGAKMAKIDTLPFFAAHTYIANIREYHPPPPPPGEFEQLLTIVKKKKKHAKTSVLNCSNCNISSMTAIRALNVDFVGKVFPTIIHLCHAERFRDPYHAYADLLMYIYHTFCHGARTVYLS